MVLFLAVFGGASIVNAQVDPRGNTRTLRTEHFRVHYPVALDSMARRAAFLAEGAWRKLADELAVPAVPIDLLIQDNVDFSNGFAQTTPSNRITIYALPPIALSELRYHDDWMRLVITHELAHIFHLDRARGLWRVGRTIFGRNEALFPNSLMPSWVTEGIAVHYESAITGSGRLVSTDFPTVALAAAHARDIHGPDAWSAITTRYPRGQARYVWGSLLMQRMADQGGDSSMRKFIDKTATFPIPFLLNRSAKLTFGKTFNGSFAGFRDSLQKVVDSASLARDSVWQRITPNSALGDWNIAYPRWRDSNTVQWVASNGREVTALYSATVPAPGTSESALVEPRRIARRNALDVNAAGPNGTTVFSQIDFADPYTLRSDLYLRDSTGDHRLTHNARLIQPDVRMSDGAIVAVQLTPGGSRLVRVSGATVTPLTHDGSVQWTEPRWDPVFHAIAAVQLLRSGVQRVVLLDTLGTVARIVAESRAVLATPSFVPNAVALVWASDRSGRMQLESADISQAFTMSNMKTFETGVMRLGSAPLIDTLWRAEVRSASNVGTSVSQPSVSPDGSRIAALIYRNNGFVLAVAPWDGGGETVSRSWYDGKQPAPNNDSTFAGASAPYRPLRQLVPRYWQPVIGEARDGGSNYGASTSGTDILGRHSYVASALVNPRNSEVNGGFAYRYSGFGLPIGDVSLTQDWDATFRITDTVGTTLGLVARRLQLASLSVGWSIPRIRWSANYAIGAQYERRNFTSETDSLLGLPGSAIRTGTRYPSLFVSGSLGNLARGARGFSAEQGVALSGTVSVRKREGLANSESWRSVGVLRAFQALPLPGYARHVIAARVAGGITDTRAPSEFSVGGVSGVSTELVPGVSFGDPSRTFPLRGFSPGSQRGLRALAGTVEYRAPIGVLARGLGLFPLFFDRFSLNTFADAGRAWCPSNAADRVAALCEAPGKRDGWLASAGAELNIDLALQYDTPYRLRLGVAKPFAAPVELSRKAAFFVTMGAFF